MNLLKIFIAVSLIFATTTTIEATKLAESIIHDFHELQTKIEDDIFDPEDAIKLLKITQTLRNAIASNHVDLANDTSEDASTLGCAMSGIAATFKRNSGAAYIHSEPKLTRMVRDILGNCMPILASVFINKTTSGNTVCPAMPRNCPAKIYCLHMCLNLILSPYEETDQASNSAKDSSYDIYLKFSEPLTQLQNKLYRDYNQFGPQDACTLLGIICTMRDAIQQNELVLTDTGEIQNLGSRMLSLAAAIQEHQEATIFYGQPLMTGMVKDLTIHCLAILGEVFLYKTTSGSSLCPALPSTCSLKSYCLHMCLDPVLAQYEGVRSRCKPTATNSRWNSCSKLSATAAALVATATAVYLATFAR